jgi:polyhydroxyalkanoate synthesis regulator phasin
MTIQSRILTEIASSLSKSTATSWRTGNFDDWVTHAKEMSNTIQTCVPVIRQIATEVENSEVKELRTQVAELTRKVQLLENNNN